MHNYAESKKPTFPDLASVAVVGARGYSGLELSRFLLRHPYVDYKYALATQPGLNLAKEVLHPKAAAVSSPNLNDLIHLAPQLKAVFLATPHEVSMELVPKLLESGTKVIDLSGAFRLQQGDSSLQLKNYSSWYNMEHKALGALNIARYGLCPWQGPMKPETQLIANPGCYATAALMALLPLLKNNLLDPESIVIDAKSGTSGAGKKATEGLLFSEVEGECLPYKIGQHQHWPEIVQTAENFTKAKIKPFLSTHLLPVRRGIVASIYAKPNRNKKLNSAELLHNSLYEAYAEAYSQYPLVRFGGRQEATEGHLLQLKHVVGTAYTHITFHANEDQIYVYSLIDNLGKGAATQAIENLNLLLGLPVETGLNDATGNL